MEKYNLDDKGGLFKFLVKSPSKVVKNGDEILLRHFSSANNIKSTVTNVSESSIRIVLKEKVPEINLSPSDHVALYYKPGNEYFVVTAEVLSVERNDPLETSLKVSKIEKLKDLIKEKKHCVSLPSNIKIIGVQDTKPAVVKNISFGGVKINCREDIMLEDMIDITVMMDKINKMSFKGRVVRKNSIGSLFEYGIEYTDLTESSNKLLTRCIHDFETMY